MVLSDGFFLGFDIGSVSLNTVVMNKNKEIIEEHYTRTMGEPLKVLHDMLVDLDARISLERAEMISFTGTGTKSVAPLLDAPFVNEIIAHTRAVEEFYPTVNTVIEMGGEDSKLILLSKDDNPARNKITDFAMNSICAAGTGSFLDQQAQRLGLSIEEFSRLALKSENPPRIAGRCSVFAKSDMIHLQQVATPDYDIIAGLCFAVARNFKGNIAKGKHIIPPVVFQGGVAANVGVVKAFRSVLELSDNELIIPRYFASMGAIGTALISMEKGESYTFPGLTKLIEFLNAPLRTHGYLKTLKPTNNHALYNKCFSGNTNKKEKIDAYLGLDVGSISTNVVVIDREKRVLAKRYLMTAGRPIEAIKTGLLEVGNEVKDTVIIRGVGTTGSGRYLTGDFIGADLVKNEITAQASAAIHIDRDVDTIFEIGGQDSKYISIKDGTIIDFEMNKVCAAGTGSFLEEQAERLGISIKEEFASLAFSSLSPVQLGERCTVFMESDVLRNMEGGTKKEDIVAGLCYSIVYNYLNKVVGDKKIGERIFFQGGTAFNKGVVSAFEQVLNVPIIVPEHHEVTGAMGVAILAMEEMDKNENKTQFKGFDLTKKSYDLTTFECQDCPNMCEVKKLTVSGEKPLFYGSRCEKYDIGKKNKIREDIADLFSEREKTLVRSLKNQKQTEHDSEVIGIPRLLTFFEFMPFWITFFSKLGFKVELSDKTNKKIIRSGAELVVAETCFPVKVAHGHIQNLIDKGIKKIFVPSIINLPSLNSHDQSFTCPYVQAFP
ncbi:MAG: acyl-CoA dehydratase activase, partial [Thermodesulfobacteriota bacterium]|nr:acyl-CoA dehydratase activase [Thermodesulfobacteriota bacterium]